MKEPLVTVSADDRATLEEALRLRKGGVRGLRRAKMLLASAENRTDREVAESFDCGHRTVGRTRARYLQGGIEAVLQDSPTGIFPTRLTHTQYLTAAQKDAIVRLASSPPPEGFHTWSLNRLADRLIELGIVNSISHETVRRVLNQKTNRVPWGRGKYPRSKKPH